MSNREEEEKKEVREKIKKVLSKEQSNAGRGVLNFTVHYVINELLKDQLKEYDVVIVISHINGMMSVWIYPSEFHLTIAGNISMTALTQIKNIVEIQLKEREKRKARETQDKYVL